MFEALENRSLLSASLTDGVLSIEGSAGDDVMNVTFAVQPGERIRYGEQLKGRSLRERFFNRSAVRRIEISARGGNDTVVVHFDDAIPLRVDVGNGGDRVNLLNPGDSTLLGGPGNDTLAGGAGDDSLDGGSGNDALQGLEGRDTLVGGWGADSLFGGSGRDVVRARDGAADSVSGDGGADRAIIDFQQDGSTPLDWVSETTENTA